MSFSNYKTLDDTLDGSLSLFLCAATLSLSTGLSRLPFS